jgi:two-component system response regulator NreC
MMGSKATAVAEQVEPEGATTRIVLVDDHAVVRSALRMLLDAEAGFEVVAEGGDAEEAARKVRAYHPDILILDLSMPGPSSLEMIPKIREDAPDTNIVVLTMEADPAFARRAMQAGAGGYVLKESADAELVKAVRLVSGGETYLTPELGARMAAQPDQSAREELSARETEVLRLIALGHTNAEIAQMLHLSVRTVESHRAHIQQKLRMTARSELVRYALDSGLLQD